MEFSQFYNDPPGLILNGLICQLLYLFCPRVVVRTVQIQPGSWRRSDQKASTAQQTIVLAAQPGRRCTARP